jgi:hypothetical protein
MVTQELNREETPLWSDGGTYFVLKQIAKYINDQC